MEGIRGVRERKRGFDLSYGTYRIRCFETSSRLAKIVFLLMENARA
jgi:hypothetical protein